MERSKRTMDTASPRSPRGLWVGCVLFVVLFCLPSLSIAEFNPTLHRVVKGDTWVSMAKGFECASGLEGAAVLCEAHFTLAENPERVKSCAEIRAGAPGPSLETGQLVYFSPECRTVPVAETGAPTTGSQGPRAEPCLDCNWTQADLKANGGVLKARMKEKGFVAPPRFRALVVKTWVTSGEEAPRIEDHQVYDYGGKAWEHKGWNPASTVKLYSSVGALVRLRREAPAFDQRARVTYHYEGGDKTVDLDYLFNMSAHVSKNLPHNRLVQLAGYDFLNGPQGLLRHRAGLNFSYVNRAYARTEWMAEGHSPSLRSSPAIRLAQGELPPITLPEVKGKADVPCGLAACTSLSDLAKFLCTLMLHKALPRNERFYELDDMEKCPEGNEWCAYESRFLRWIRQNLNRRRWMLPKMLGSVEADSNSKVDASVGSAKKNRQKRDPVWATLEKTLGVVSQEKRYLSQQGPVRAYRKAGWAGKWASDVLYIEDDREPVRWIVAMACYGERYCLGSGERSAAQVVAELIRDKGL